METTYQGFRTYYAQLTDDDLRNVAGAETVLVEAAQRALAEELAKRGITSADIDAYKADMQTHAFGHQQYLRNAAPIWSVDIDSGVDLS